MKRVSKTDQNDTDIINVHKLGLGGSNFSGNPINTSARIVITDDNGNNSDIVQQVAGGATASYNVGQSGGTIASPTASSKGDAGLAIRNYMYSGSGFLESARISMGIDDVASATVSNVSMPGAISLYTTANGSAAPSSPAMRIVNSGWVGINKNTPTSTLDVSGTVTATGFSGPLTGNASSATKLQTARTINGVAFDGSADIAITETDPVFTASPASSITSTDVTNIDNLSGVNTGDQDLSGLVPTTRTVAGQPLSADVAIAASNLSATGISSTKFLRGDNTWQTPPNTTYTAMTVAEGQAGTATTARTVRADYLKTIINYFIGLGTAAKATILATARNINGVPFDGSADITVTDDTKVPTTRTVNGHSLDSNVTVTASDIGLPDITVSTTQPSSPAVGDLWVDTN